MFMHPYKISVCKVTDPAASKKEVFPWVWEIAQIKDNGEYIYLGNCRIPFSYRVAGTAFLSCNLQILIPESGINFVVSNHTKGPGLNNLYQNKAPIFPMGYPGYDGELSLDE